MAKETSKNSVQPLGDRVLVKREDKPAKKSVSGIYIPETAEKEKSKRGVIISVGAGRMTDTGVLLPMTVKIGAKVYFNAGWDNEVDMGEDGEEYFLVREADILAVIK